MMETWEHMVRALWSGLAVFNRGKQKAIESRLTRSPD